MFQKNRNSDNNISYLSSVSDLMAGLLFIFAIALIIQADSYTSQLDQQAKDLALKEKSLQEIQLKLSLEQQKVKESLEKALVLQKQAKRLEEENANIRDRLIGNDDAREALLQRIQQRLKERDIPVIINASNGVLRVPEKALTFETGSAQLHVHSQKVLQSIREVLQDEIPCYSQEYSGKLGCRQINPNQHTLDAVFVEGHTDNQPYGGDLTGHRNRTLATARANTVYDALMNHGGNLPHFKNPKGELLFSLSGYGSARPVPGHEHEKPTNDHVNRRIEIRFLMSSPDLEIARK